MREFVNQELNRVFICGCNNKIGLLKDIFNLIVFTIKYVLRIGFHPNGGIDPVDSLRDDLYLGFADIK